MPPRKLKEKSETVTPPSTVLETSSVSTPISRRERHFAPATFVFGALFVVALGLAGYFYYQYSHTKEVMEAREITELTEKIGNVMDLPADEVPTLATVTNKEKLDDQAFFKKAENGDQILIYSIASRAILYRPSLEKIIDVTTLSIVRESGEVVAPAPEITSTEVAADSKVEPTVLGESTEATSSTESVVLTEPTELVEATPVVVRGSVTLFNGSKKVGVTAAVETSLVTRYPDIQIAAKEKATQNDYSGLLIIPLKGDTTVATELATFLGGTLATQVPAGETAPPTDFLVIVGNK